MSRAKTLFFLFLGAFSAAFFARGRDPLSVVFFLGLLFFLSRRFGWLPLFLFYVQFSKFEVLPRQSLSSFLPVAALILFSLSD